MLEKMEKVSEGRERSTKCQWSEKMASLSPQPFHPAQHKPFFFFNDKIGLDPIFVSNPIEEGSDSRLTWHKIHIYINYPRPLQKPFPFVRSQCRHSNLWQKINEKTN